MTQTVDNETLEMMRNFLGSQPRNNQLWKFSLVHVFLHHRYPCKLLPSILKLFKISISVTLHEYKRLCYKLIGFCRPSIGYANNFGICCCKVYSVDHKREMGVAYSRKLKLEIGIEIVWIMFEWPIWFLCHLVVDFATFTRLALHITAFLLLYCWSAG